MNTAMICLIYDELLLLIAIAIIDMSRVRSHRGQSIASAVVKPQSTKFTAISSVQASALETLCYERARCVL